MKALVVYCHPRSNSYTAAVRDTVMDRLSDHGAEIRLIDLYGAGFNPVMTADEHEAYEDEAANTRGLEPHIADLQWCDTLIFVYPTWWYGMPAVLKGWLDRTLVPGVAFHLPNEVHKNIQPGLPNITRLGVFTTCGASRWLTFMIGSPGRRTLLRGFRLICAGRCKTTFAAHYSIDSSTAESRAAHLAKVAAKMDRFIGPKPTRQEARA